jgi:hypothetical protein
MTLATHSGQLERWLGVEKCEELSGLMRDWYGPPIAVAGVPGQVFAHRGGDFRGRIRSGWHSSAMDHVEAGIKRLRRSLRRTSLTAGFASMDALIAACSAGQRIPFAWQKAGATGVVQVTNSLWGVGALPPAGANSSGAPGGTVPDDSTTGAVPFTNPGGSDTLHITAGYAQASVAGQTLLLYDRLFGVNKTMASTATEAVTGVPTRYQSTTANAADSAEGNFLFVEVGGTALAATAHNWTVCLYTDQSGNTGATLPSLTGNASAIVRRLDHPVGQWFAPLATGDTGVRALTQMQCSASVATGVINFVIGHPLFWMPIPLANIMVPKDGVTGIFSLVRIFNDAALALMEVTKPATTATNYNVFVEAVYD